MIRYLVLIIFLASCREADDLAPNTPPVAVAGPDQLIKTGDNIILDGSSSFDENGNTLYFSWSFVSKPSTSNAIINNFDRMEADFIADQTGTYLLKLLVYDGIDTDSDTLEVVAALTNLPSSWVQSWTSVTSPVMMAMNASGDLFVSGYATHVIYRITPDGSVTTFAGTGQAGYLDEKSGNAQFRNPSGLAFDDAGNLFIADYGNHCIRKISTSGIVSTVAGSPQAGYLDGQGGQAQFNFPAGLTIDDSDNLYVTEIGNDRIRKITPSAIVSTIAGGETAGYNDGKGTAALFNNPTGITLDLNNDMIIADAGNNRIRKISSGDNVSTIAGDGTAGFQDGIASSAQFNLPYGAEVDKNGIIYIADANNNRIRMIANGIVSVFAGNGAKSDKDGIAPEASFNNPFFVLYDATLNIFYVADFNNNKIKKIVPE